MKHFVISALVFALVLAFVCANGALVRRKAGELLEKARSLAPDGAAEFERTWLAERRFFSVSVHECELERVDEAACDAVSAAENGDENAFFTAKRRLTAALGSLAGGELWNTDGIF